MNQNLKIALIAIIAVAVVQRVPALRTPIFGA